MRLSHASPPPVHPPHTVRPWMWANAKMRAVQRPCDRRGGASARGGSCCGVVGAHRSKVRLWAHARRGRLEALDVPALNKGAIAPGSRTCYPSFEAPCTSGRVALDSSTTPYRLQAVFRHPHERPPLRARRDRAGVYARSRTCWRLRTRTVASSTQGQREHKAHVAARTAKFLTAAHELEKIAQKIGYSKCTRFFTTGRCTYSGSDRGCRFYPCNESYKRSDATCAVLDSLL